MIEKLKSHLEEHNLDIKDLEIRDDEGKEIDYHDLKIDMTKLGEVYAKYFNEVYRLFKNSNDREIRTFLENHKNISIEIIRLMAYKFRKTNFGRSEAENQLRDFVLSQYYMIIDFFDTCSEVLGE